MADTVKGYPVVYNKYSAAAKLLQAALGVKQDGYIGPKTLAAWEAYDIAINRHFSIPDAAALDTIIQNIKTTADMADTSNALSIATQFVEKWEGFEKDLGNGTVQAYWDSYGGLWTIGWGSTFYQDGTPISAGDILTYDQANALFQWELSKTEAAIRPYVTVMPSLTDAQYAASISIAYNWGTGAFTKSSLLKLINSGASTDDIATAWKATAVTAQGVYVQGLANRRADEALLFQGGYDTSSAGNSNGGSTGSTATIGVLGLLLGIGVIYLLVKK